MSFALTIQTAEEIAVAEAAAIRASSVITRREFCLALVAHGVLTSTDAIAAAKGDWPSALNDFLEYLTIEQSTDVQIEWAAVGTVERMNPLVLVLGSWMGLTDQQVDAMFGLTPA